MCLPAVFEPHQRSFLSAAYAFNEMLRDAGATNRPRQYRLKMLPESSSWKKPRPSIKAPQIPSGIDDAVPKIDTSGGCLKLKAP